MIRRVARVPFENPSLRSQTPQLRRAFAEFHISAKSRNFYKFDQGLFAQSGNVIFTNFHASRLFAQKMNEKRDLVSSPEQVVRAGHVNAMGLIDEILHLVIERYRELQNPQVMQQALAWLNEQVGEQKVDTALLQFIEEFPPLAVYRGEQNPEEYLSGESIHSLITPDQVDKVEALVIPNRSIALEEMLLLWLANSNPAFIPFLDLFDDTSLKSDTPYLSMISGLHDFFDTQKPFGPDQQNLIDMLRSPAIKVPNSMSGQLEYIRSRWGYLLGKYLYRLLSSLDLIKEEEKAIFGVGGGGSSKVYDFTGREYLYEPERFSPDQDWMPNLVLIAKNIFVWLDQLSKKYGRAITHLDQIPPEELDQLARWGFTGLWLIGLWERSVASRTIKQMRGNLEAVASAYSLYGYEIASELGGENAYQMLAQQAWRCGIRLASDMVPNHMGIDSRWVIEHPEWFISLSHSPFPAYSFNGANLSQDERVGINIEDHYYDNTDAAVVFKRQDFWTGDEKYIYHGNDGTSMPWNDTAQLNYLLPEVREAVIQTILHVARKFPIIRFDAAMTLAKRHYQRLWFPEPGSGGDIPSRAEHGMTKTQFDKAFPEEFWRQVVDRVAQEVPGTLLLAEAFWLMEGYFVRTLGMHRVYNSAFMNMLRDEKNQEYRLVIKNTLEFDPEILKRYVNFMNNPDERTAVDQFGKGDKYFGICTMMVTMPGLPMFGHGQVEGYSEKYGMEFKRAYWEEEPDIYLVERHQREIFPLLHRRNLFADVQNFYLYDFYTTDGHVNEDVFAYSNRAGDQRALVVYHNTYSTTRGWIRISAAFSVKTGKGDEKVLLQKNLGEGLNLHNDPDFYIIFRENTTGLEYIRSSQELFQQGLYVELEAYKYHAFLDFREVRDDENHHYAQLTALLNGRGVPDVQEALREMLLQPLLTPYSELVNPGMLEWLIGMRLNTKSFEPKEFGLALEEVFFKYRDLLDAVKSNTTGDGDSQALASEMNHELDTLLSLSDLETPSLVSKDKSLPETIAKYYKEATEYLLDGPDGNSSFQDGDPVVWGTFLCCLFTYKLGKVFSTSRFSEQSRAWIDEWLLGKQMEKTLEGLGSDEDNARRHVNLVRALTSHQEWYQIVNKISKDRTEEVHKVLEIWLQDVEVQNIIQVHRHQEILWFNKEAFQELLWWMFTLAVVQIFTETRQNQMSTDELILTSPPTEMETKTRYNDEGTMAGAISHLVPCFEVVCTILKAAEDSGYQLERLLQSAG